MKRRFVVCACCICLLFAARTASALDYETRLNPLVPVDEIWLPAEVPEGKPIFLDPLLAVDILSVECDGKQVDAVYGSYRQESRRYVETVNAPMYIYRIVLNGGIWVPKLKDVTTDLVSAIGIYTLPKRWESLLITYRTRFADGSFSKNKYSALFRRVTFEEDLRGLQNQQELQRKGYEAREGSKK